MTTSDRAPDPIVDDPETFAKLTTDQLVGFRVPRDNEPAYVLRCLYKAQKGRRFFFALSGSYGPITVARQHATRFPTKDEAIARLKQLRGRGGIPWKLVRLRPSDSISEQRSTK